MRDGDDLLLVVGTPEATRMTLHLVGLLAGGGLLLAPRKVWTAVARPGAVPFPVLGLALSWRDRGGGLRLG